MIHSTKVIDKRSNLVYVIPTNNELKNIPSDCEDFVKRFIESDKKEDFIKTSRQTIFFVKEQTDLEKMRVAGFNVRKQLDKKEDTLTVIGHNEATLALAEGLMLANYQFLKYFKDKEEKAYSLKEIYICGNVSEERIKQISNTIKAVYWARDMVNEPVCYLTADQLSKEVEKLGKEAKFSVKVLHKAQIEELGMGGLLAVNSGSVLPPTFTVIEYKPANPINKKPIADRKSTRLNSSH